MSDTHSNRLFIRKFDMDDISFRGERFFVMYRVMLNSLPWKG